ncbi:hypothetical protein SAMN05216436_12764 [bacterium A37T11]|nr:hypothetical protein SAMN05216436_12764 [bacterium A37T11]
MELEEAKQKFIEACSLIPPLYKGFFYANLFAIGLIGICHAFKLDDGVFIFSQFVIIPLLMGIISAWFWRQELDCLNPFRLRLISLVACIRFSCWPTNLLF